jgi:hypothetical protein
MFNIFSTAAHDKLIAALDRNEADKSKKNMRAKLRDAGRYVVSERGARCTGGPSEFG